jgi:protein phosphatase PTC7
LLTHHNSLGDSGHTLFSPLKLTGSSTPQTHAFNTPFQLSKIPRPLATRLALFGSVHHAETPADADIYRHKVTHGDVFVLATDGIWDNLAAEDVLRVVSNVMVKFGAWIVPLEDGRAVRVGEKLAVLAEPVKDNAALSSHIARAVVRESKVASLDTRRDGPFAKEVRRHFPREEWRGGKVDDICCVVGVVVQDGL